MGGRHEQKMCSNGWQHVASERTPEMSEPNHLLQVRDGYPDLGTGLAFYHLTITKIKVTTVQ